MKTDKYPPRTFANVRGSDGTIRLAYDFTTAGERCTLGALLGAQKPYFDVDLRDPPPVEEAKKWLLENKIAILNVAGNRESTHAGVGRAAEKYLTTLFSLVRDA